MRISDWSSDVCSSDLPSVTSKNPPPKSPPAPSPANKSVPKSWPSTRTALSHSAVKAIPTPVLDPVLFSLSAYLHIDSFEIGRASCRERVCWYVEIAVVAVSLKKKKIQILCRRR